MGPALAFSLALIHDQANVHDVFTDTKEKIKNKNA